MPDLKRKILSTAAARMASLVLSTLTVAVTARTLGAEGRGEVTAVTAWVAMFMTFGYLSLGQVAIHHATDRRGTHWLSDALGTLLALTGLITFGGWIAANLLFLTTQGRFFNHYNAEVMVLGFINLPFLIWEQYGSSLLIALDRVALYNRAQLVGRSVGFLCMLIFLVGLHAGVSGALAAIVVSQALTSMGGLRVLLDEARKQTRVRARRETARALLSGGIRLHLNAIGSYLLLSTDVLVVSHYRGKTETGYYGLAIQIAAILSVLAQSAGTILTSQIAQSGPDSSWPMHRAVLKKTMLCVLFVIAAAIVLAPICVTVVGGRDFTPTIGVFKLVAINVLFASFGSLMGPQWIGRGLFLQASGITLVVGTFNLIANLILVPKYGMTGSAISTVASGAIGAAINLAFYFWIERRHRSLQVAS